MPVLSTNLTLSSQTYPLNHARILYNSIATTSNTIVSSESAGFPGVAAINSDTYEYWLPASMPATFTVDYGTAVDVDAVGIGAHTFATDNVTITIEYSTDAISWNAVSVGSFGAQDGTPVLALFDSVFARYWRVTFAGSTPPQIGVLFIGEALQMARPFYGGHTPINYGRVTSYVGNMSDGGQTLGTSIIRKGTSTDFAWKHLPRGWIDSDFKPFIKQVRAARPFFIAWNPLQYSTDVGYVYVGQDIRPVNMGIRDYMEVSFTAQGLSDE